MHIFSLRTFRLPGNIIPSSIIIAVDFIFPGFLPRTLTDGRSPRVFRTINCSSLRYETSLHFFLAVFVRAMIPSFNMLWI